MRIVQTRKRSSPRVTIQLARESPLNWERTASTCSFMNFAVPRSLAASLRPGLFPPLWHRPWETALIGRRRQSLHRPFHELEGRPLLPRESILQLSPRVIYRRTENYRDRLWERPCPSPCWFTQTSRRRLAVLDISEICPSIWWSSIAVFRTYYFVYLILSANKKLVRSNKLSLSIH